MHNVYVHGRTQTHDHRVGSQTPYPTTHFLISPLLSVTCVDFCAILFTCFQAYLCELIINKLNPLLAFIFISVTATNQAP